MTKPKEFEMTRVPNFYKVTSDNFYNDIMTAESYKIFRMQMSSGDFGSHEATLIDLSTLEPNERIIDSLGTQDEYNVFLASYYQAKYGVKFRKPKTVKPKKVLAKVFQFDASKSTKNIGPRERLLKNQRKLFGYIAPVVSLEACRQQKLKRIT